jgi:cytochrome bd ubiquinol oxidase subunit II
VTLAEFWFVLIGFMFASYFVLEGFDFGVGVLLPILGKDDIGRRVMINTIGPIWDANETWLVLAAGAMFAAFPHWYATAFSAFYLPLLVILAALIVRGLAFEFRGKIDDEQWRRKWDRCIVFGSIIVPFLWGMFFANLVGGMAINDAGDYAGGVLDLFSPYTILGGLAVLAMFVTHGAIFVALKTRGGIRHDARELATRLGVVTIIVSAAFLSWTIGANGGLASTLLAIAVVAASVGAVLANARGNEGIAFFGTASSIVLLVTTYFALLYPNVMTSTIDPANNLTIVDASSTPYTLTVMTWVAVLVVPFVLAYQVWSYWVFRKRLSRDVIPLIPQHGAVADGGRST